MTTETSRTRTPTPVGGAGALGRILTLAGGSALALTALTVGLAGLAGGRAGAYGALVGALMALGVFAFGTVVVQVTARLVPATALLVALVTFVLQALVMALAFWRLDRSGLLTGPGGDGTLDRVWLAIALIVGTLAWSVGQILVVTRSRQPLYDLPEAGAR